MVYKDNMIVTAQTIKFAGRKFCEHISNMNGGCVKMKCLIELGI